jgi:hypothetical protein
MNEQFAEYEKLSVLGLKLNVQVGDDSFIGEVFYHDEHKKLLILSRTLWLTEGNSSWKLESSISDISTQIESVA